MHNYTDTYVYYGRGEARAPRRGACARNPRTDQPVRALFRHICLSLYICVHLFMYIHIYIYIYMYEHICIYIHIFGYIYMCR